MLFRGGFGFANFLMDVLTVFVFVVWFWSAYYDCERPVLTSGHFRVG